MDILLNRYCRQKWYWIHKPVYRVALQLKKLVMWVMWGGGWQNKASWGKGRAWQYQSFTPVGTFLVKSNLFSHTCSFFCTHCPKNYLFSCEATLWTAHVCLYVFMSVFMSLCLYVSIFLYDAMMELQCT